MDLRRSHRSLVKMLPPQTCTEVLAQLTTEVLLNILVGVVLTGGIGLAVRVGTKKRKLKLVTVTSHASPSLNLAMS
nr:hypothetical protein [Pseudomonas sp. QTF5]